MMWLLLCTNYGRSQHCFIDFISHFVLCMVYQAVSICDIVIPLKVLVAICSIEMHVMDNMEAYKNIYC